MLERIVDGRTDLVFRWLAEGGPPDATDVGGTSLIRWCAYYGDVSAIRHLLAHGALLGDLGPNLDLGGAAFHGHWRLVQFLLESGAEADRADPESGETPLHLALCKAMRPGYEPVVKLLLAHGADPRRGTRAGATSTAFMRDVRCRGETALHRAAAFGSEAVIEMLLDAGAEREVRDANGDTPLAWASWHLRPPAILRRLCFGPHRIHPDANWASDHGDRWGYGLEHALLGRPHIDRTESSQ